MDRAAKLMWVIVASAIAGGALTAVPRSAAAAPDACLSGPQGAAPKGQRWYYHLDRATQQKCWYLRAPGDSAAQAAAPQQADSQSPAPPATAAPPATTPLRTAARQPHPSATQNAHAEWPAPNAGSGPDSTGSVPQPATQQAWPPANPAGAQGAPLAAQQDAPSQPVATDTRTADSSAALQSTTSPPPASQASQTTPTDAAPAGSATASPAKSPEPIHILLLVIAGALVLAGLIASIVYRLSARQRAARQDVRARRSINWEPAVASAPPPRRGTPAPSLIAIPAQIAVEPTINRDARDRDSRNQDFLDQDLLKQDLRVQDLRIQGLRVQDRPVQDLPVQNVSIQDLQVLDLQVQDLHTQDSDAQDSDAQYMDAPDLDAQDLDSNADIGQITDLLEQFIKRGPRLELSPERTMPAADIVHPELQRLARSGSRA